MYKVLHINRQTIISEGFLVKYWSKLMNFKLKILFSNISVISGYTVLTKWHDRFFIANIYCPSIANGTKPKSLYRSRAGRHFLEQEIRFGLVLGQLALLKWLWVTFESSFFKFSGAEFFCWFFEKNIVVSALKSCMKWKWENKIKLVIKLKKPKYSQ